MKNGPARRAGPSCGMGIAPHYPINSLVIINVGVANARNFQPALPSTAVFFLTRCSHAPKVRNQSHSECPACNAQNETWEAGIRQVPSEGKKPKTSNSYRTVGSAKKRCQ